MVDLQPADDATLATSRLKIEQQQGNNENRLHMDPILAELTTTIETNYKTHHRAADYANLLHLDEAIGPIG